MDPGHFNRSRTTLSGLLSGEDGMSLEERRMWGAMRMDPRDISDVTGATYTFLVNGHGPADDLEFKHGTNAPTVRVEGMTVAGT